MSTPLNKYSQRITQPRARALAGHALRTGLSDDDMSKPQVGIASVWFEGNTCNMHLNDLAAEVKQGVTQAGMVGMRFNTIGVSDGISMGTERDELFAAVARHHRRFGRNVDGRSLVRRVGRSARLRQEHARLRDRHGAVESSGDHDLRRDDSGRAFGRQEAGHRVGVSIVRRVSGGSDRR